MSVLAVGCHPDDLEIACGGTLRKYVEQGAEVYTCHVANGNQGHVVIEPEPLTAMCAEEFEEASRIIGAKQTFNLNVGDMPVNSHDLAVMDAMADVVRCTRPDVIITHYDAVRKCGAGRRHGDHAGIGGKLPREMELQKAYTSAEDMLNDPDIDAVYIASPVFLHAQQAMAAADAGKHILIEKPLAMTAAEGQKVVEHCREKGVLIAASFMMRLGACIQAMKKAIAEGKIGKPVSAYAQFTCWYPDIPGAWRQKKTQGGYDAQQDHAARSGSRARRMLVFYVLIC